MANPFARAYLELKEFIENHIQITRQARVAASSVVIRALAEDLARWPATEMERSEPRKVIACH